MVKNKFVRITWIDYVRCIAILLVILMHASEQAGVSDLFSRSLLSSIGRLGVPLFLMISGALMLPKVFQYSISEYSSRYQFYQANLQQAPVCKFQSHLP